MPTGADMGILFNPERIITGGDVPTFYCHGTRHIEFLEGGIVRIWLCEDQPVAMSGLAPMSKPVAIMLAPIACYVWNILAHAEYAFDRGILQTKPHGPVELRPTRKLLM